jgi:hypothetical protein
MMKTKFHKCTASNIRGGKGKVRLHSVLNSGRQGGEL